MKILITYVFISAYEPMLRNKAKTGNDCGDHSWGPYAHCLRVALSICGASTRLIIEDIGQATNHSLLFKRFLSNLFQMCLH